MIVRLLIALLLISAAVSTVVIMHPTMSEAVYAEAVALLILIKSAAIKSAIVVKAKSVSFFTTSVAYIVGFVKGLTLFQFLMLSLKRFIIDNIISKWLERNVFSHLIPVLKSKWVYFRKINWRTRIRKSMYFALPFGVGAWVLIAGDFITSVAIYAQLKVLIAGFFQFIWFFVAKIFTFFLFIFTNFIMGTWLAAIIEILAISYLLSLLEKIPVIGPYITAFLRGIYNFLERSFKFMLGGYRKVTSGNKFNGKVSTKLEAWSLRMHKRLDDNKNSTELEIFEAAMKTIETKGPKGYFVKGKKHAFCKNELYQLINRNNADSIDVVAHITTKGNVNAIDGDVMLLEGVATHSGHGASTGDFKDKGFWVFNNSESNWHVLSKKNLFLPTKVAPGEFQYIEAIKEVSYIDKSIYLLNNRNEKKTAIPVLPTRK